MASVASELVDLVRAAQTFDVVCISAMPPAAVMHARYLCRRLRGRFPKVQLVVGLWNAPSDLNKAKERIACGTTVHVVATLADAQEQIRLLIEPLVPRSDKHVTLDCDPLVAEGALPAKPGMKPRFACSVMFWPENGKAAHDTWLWMERA